MLLQLEKKNLFSDQLQYLPNDDFQWKLNPFAKTKQNKKIKRHLSINWQEQPVNIGKDRK